MRNHALRDKFHNEIPQSGLEDRRPDIEAGKMFMMQTSGFGLPSSGFQLPSSYMFKNTFINC
jgi:hypothetical protein